MHTYSTAQQAHPLASVWGAFTIWVVTISAKNGRGWMSVCVYMLCRSECVALQSAGAVGPSPTPAGCLAV